MKRKNTTKTAQSLNTAGLKPEDITSHAAFRIAGVGEMSPSEQMSAKVQLRKAARDMGFKASEFETIWDDYMESLKPDPSLTKVSGGLSEEVAKVHSKLKLKENSIPASTTDNYVTIMKEDKNLQGRILYNEFAQRMERRGDVPWSTGRDGGWTDCDDAELYSYIERTYHIANRSKLADAMNIVAHKNGFHPVVERLEALSPWDGKARIGKLFPRYLGAVESDYTTAVTLNWMLGAISRVYHPGCKYDYVLILVGNQGTGKSTMLRKMSLDDDWFDDSIGALSGRENSERLHGKWLIELQELKALRREKDAESIKAFITTQNDYYREPYARRAEDHPRQCVFAGTTNEDFFLTDRTGNRRFIPLEVAGADPADLFTPECKAFIEQCWAEALTIFREEGQKPSLKLPDDIEKQAIDNQRSHLEEDARTSLIQKWLDDTHEPYVAVIDIWTEALLQAGVPSVRESNEIHKIMRFDIKGWKASATKHRTARSGSPVKCYERCEAEQERSDSEDGWVKEQEDVPF